MIDDLLGSEQYTKSMTSSKFKHAYVIKYNILCESLANVGGFHDYIERMYI